MPPDGNHKYEDFIIIDNDGNEYKLKNLSDAPEIVNLFDEEEIYENCTVQILRNSQTKTISIGWWQNENESTT